MYSINSYLAEKLENVVNGDPWYGTAVTKILDQVSELSIHNRPDNAHSVAEILLHMVAWTEEVNERLQGGKVKVPSRGDWPDPAGIEWMVLKDLFSKIHYELKEQILNFPKEKWEDYVDEERIPALGSGTSFKETVEGLIHHHIYHIGQIAILNKQFSSKEVL
ncbi:DinB family protein [Rubrolithibacter danxiaensis]|uniref:DinB family protein n=1 Tax=Rubrolithibacter danxiaensis TaxID=3390805 RepID=UPI003BF8ED14